MPKPKPVSQIMGNGRGAYRKALLSMLLRKYAQKDAFQIAITELGEECIYCESKLNLQEDHLWPEDMGGIHVVGNVAPACPGCNSRRGNRNWKDFLLSVQKDTENGKSKKVKQIEIYMKKYKMEQPPSMGNYLTEQEIELRLEFDLILDAISQGIRAKVGNQQKKEVKFNKADKMFDEIVRIAMKYRLDYQKHNVTTLEVKN